MVNVETILSWVLRTGVLLSMVLMVTGFIFSPTILWAGIVVLVLTPLFRVVISGFAFLINREPLFFIIAAYVIIVLVISILFI